VGIYLIKVQLKKISDEFYESTQKALSGEIDNPGISILLKSQFNNIYTQLPEPFNGPLSENICRVLVFGMNPGYQPGARVPKIETDTKSMYFEYYYTRLKNRDENRHLISPKGEWMKHFIFIEDCYLSRMGAEFGSNAVYVDAVPYRTNLGFNKLNIESQLFFKESAITRIKQMIDIFNPISVVFLGKDPFPYSEVLYKIDPILIDQYAKYTPVYSKILNCYVQWLYHPATKKQELPIQYRKAAEAMRNRIKFLERTKPDWISKKKHFK
jgi:hypothetical protein